MNSGLQPDGMAGGVLVGPRLVRYIPRRSIRLRWLDLVLNVRRVRLLRWRKIFRRTATSLAERSQMGFRGRNLGCEM